MSNCEGCSGCTVDSKVVDIVDKYKNVQGSIIPALHEVQDIYGYIPESIQKYLSKELDISMSEIYGIITFYSRFSLMPKGKFNIQVCTGTACYVKGSDDIINEFKKILNVEEGQTTKDGMFSLEAVRCLGTCSLAPVFVVNEDVYGKSNKDMVQGIIDKYNEVK